jgi:hypothetical protein
MCDPNLSWHASLFFETWSHARQTQQHEMLRGRQGWRYDDAKPEMEGTNVRPKKFSSPIIRVPVIHCISTIAVRWTWGSIDLYSYTPALWSRSTPSPGHTCSSTPNISANDACRVGTAGTNDDRPQTPILSAAPVTMSISVLCFCCLKMLESHSLLLRIHHFRCLS